MTESANLKAGDRVIVCHGPIIKRWLDYNESITGTVVRVTFSHHNYVWVRWDDKITTPINRDSIRLLPSQELANAVQPRR